MLQELAFIFLPFPSRMLSCEILDNFNPLVLI